MLWCLDHLRHHHSGAPMAEIIDFQAAKAERNLAFARKLGAIEYTLMVCRPYASMDDLPDVTPAGQRAIAAHIAGYVWAE